MIRRRESLVFFFFNDTATTEIYTLSLHDALPIYVVVGVGGGEGSHHIPEFDRIGGIRALAAERGDGDRQRIRRRETDRLPVIVPGRRDHDATGVAGVGDGGLGGLIDRSPTEAQVD